MTDDSTHLRRRKLLKRIGVGSLASVAGCVGLPGLDGGGGNSGENGGQSFLEAAEQLNLGQNTRDRRMATTEEWPIEQRRDVPERNSDTSWEGFESYESAPWSPPDGWEDTPAGDVDTLEIVNHGAVTMEFDPAILATQELFERETGIELDLIEVGVSDANQQEQQALRSESSSPHIMVINGPLLPQFVERGYLKPLDTLYPSEEIWDLYTPALRQMAEWDIDPTLEGTHAYSSASASEVSIGNLRTDLIREQGLDPQRYQGEWSWDLLEETMQAFEGTGIFGYAYYAGTPSYLSYSFRGLLYAQGGQLVQDNGNIRVDTEAAIRTTEKMAEWYQNGWVPQDVISYGEGDIVDLFLSDQLAFTTAFSGLIPTALETYTAGEQFQAVLPPMATSGPDPSPRPLFSPNATSINTFSDTPHSLAALLYEDLRLTYASQWWEYTYEGNISYVEQVYDDAAEYDFSPFPQVLDSAVENAFIELFPGMQNLFTQMATPVQQAIQGQRDPEEAMQSVQEWVDSNLNQN